LLVKGLVKAGKRFGDIINFMQIDEEKELHRSSLKSSARSRTSKSRSMERKRSKLAQESGYTTAISRTNANSQVEIGAADFVNDFIEAPTFPNQN
jgi:hypothetical protein